MQRSRSPLFTTSLVHRVDSDCESSSAESGSAGASLSADENNADTSDRATDDAAGDAADDAAGDAASGGVASSRLGAEDSASAQAAGPPHALRANKYPTFENIEALNVRRSINAKRPATPSAVLSATFPVKPSATELVGGAHHHNQ